MNAAVAFPEPRVRHLPHGYVLVENVEIGVFFGEEDLEVLADVILPPVIAGPGVPGAEFVIHAVRTFPAGRKIDPVDWTEEQRDHVEAELADEALRISWESRR